MNQPKHLTQEADIGSGERSPAQQETDKMIEQVPPNHASNGNDTRNQPNRSRKNDANTQSGNSP